MSSIRTNMKTVASIVADDMRTAMVFKRHGIDFCCGGGKSVSESCKSKGIDPEIVFGEIENLEISTAESDFNNMPLDDLVEYILTNHHSYVKESLPSIIQFANKVAKVHGHAQPETVKIAELFNLISQELEMHLLKEERMLFPYIIELVQSRGYGESVQAPFGTVKNPIIMMEQEHESVGEIFREIERLSNNFTPPSYACSTYKALYFHLKEFQDDLHIHIHLENNILFPKAIDLELN
ncbi:MAG: iron-sulfur cluster repair di-iron protein [Flavobacteriales bacterium]|nr:iron-sulfur cluster repair di-iron protein [Flavobacteriales bacterium]